MLKQKSFVYNKPWRVVLGPLRAICCDMSTIEIKGSLFTFFVVRILSADTEQFAHDFRLWVQKSPGFLSSAPVVLQPSLACSLSHPELMSIMDILRNAGCFPIGIITTDEKTVAASKECGLALISKDPQKKAQSDRVSASAKVIPAQIVNHAVRSGQQLYAKNRDLIVLGSVNHGAEVVADGNIHIYGSLRGKALAGAAGFEQSCIFVRDFSPQMVAIAGYYKNLDEIPPEFLEKAVQSSLVNSQLSFSTI